MSSLHGAHHHVCAEGHNWYLGTPFGATGNSKNTHKTYKMPKVWPKDRRKDPCFII